jgi:hypothetical protein
MFFLRQFSPFFITGVHLREVNFVYPAIDHDEIQIQFAVNDVLRLPGFIKDIKYRLRIALADMKDIVKKPDLVRQFHAEIDIQLLHENKSVFFLQVFNSELWDKIQAVRDIAGE